jgi:magnesium transporter
MTKATLHQEVVRRLLLTGSQGRVQRIIDKLHPADIAELFGALSPGELRNLLDVLVATGRAGRTLRELPEALRADLLKQLDDTRLTLIISRLPPDDAYHLLALLPEERRAAIVERVPSDRRDELDRLLRYAPGTAGALMTPRVLALPEGATADAAIEEMRHLGDRIEEASYLYVVDEDRRLRGVVPLRRLVAAPPSQALGQIMIEDPVSVGARADQEEVARLVSKYNLLAIPVIDEEGGQLLGVISVDDVIEVIHQEATEDMYHMAGLSEDERVFSPFGRSVNRRAPWMIANLATAFLAASVVGLFQDSINQMVALAVFMPIVAGMGGNMGTQTLTVITRGLALGELQFSSGLRAILKEVGVGSVVGAISGLLAGLIAYLWLGNPVLGLVLFLAMMANLAVAGLAGAAIPLALKAIGLDPALGSGVIVTAFTDCFGFLCFLGLATALMQYLH